MNQHFLVYGIVFLTTCLIVQQACSQDIDSERKLTRKMIDVGGYKLNFNYVQGTLPAIVFECGGGMTSSQWKKIQRTLSATTRNAIVSYDRAGHGKSELPDTEYDIESEMAALRAGLEALGVADDVILVGHSYAAFLMTVYTHQYPDSVRSILYIDPITVSFESLRQSKSDVEDFDPGKFPNTKYGKALSRQVRALPRTLEALQSIPIPEKPYLVISAEKRWMETDEENDAFRRGQKELANFNGTEPIIAEGSDHFVPRRAPELVLRVIGELLAK